MGQWITLDTAHGPVAAWEAMPPGAPRAGLVVVQEIFGVNAHIRDVADRYAAQGYAVLAPAFFDPVEKNVELAYDQADFARGRELVGKLGLDAAVDIVQAAAQRLKADAGVARVGSVGYCWGGTVALLAAQRLGLPSASYYGARNVPFLDLPFKAPVIFHFGELDTSIPPEMVQQHRDKLPQMAVHTYPAGHAFNRDVDPKAYDAASAALALERTLEFFARELA
ncbi:dienelactone hydrolase family protein [Stenotrophomonas sp. MMGLT7]|uniref:dienelactone hydrolase family protein n=1 Tax=Stenotrophomonas sp. MMGLT7 TaxID=2901227 RepID=UPI001E575692|nr:dienelactone hydrolase family protein [Stenotrophomonas sp. MMGLT7]MCD7098659.1 dienelactone hydrolase family protein [Stenotrophomonas sp. MMGLT7]